jgi:hypothetical protein
VHRMRKHYSLEARDHRPGNLSNGGWTKWCIAPVVGEPGLIGLAAARASTSRRRRKVRRLSQVDDSAPAIAEGTGITNAAFATLDGASPTGRARSSEPSAACRIIRADVPRAPKEELHPGRLAADHTSAPSIHVRST